MDDPTEQPWGDPLPATVPDDDHEWRIPIGLPLLASLTVRDEYKEEWRRSFGRAARTGPLGVAGDGRIGPPQDRAVRWLRDNEAVARDRILTAIAALAAGLRDGGGWELAVEDPPGIDAVMPRDMTPDQAAERIELHEVVVTPDVRDGLAYLELYGACAWDADHGIRIVLHGDRVVDVSEQGGGWDDPVP